MQFGVWGLLQQPLVALCDGYVAAHDSLGSAIGAGTLPSPSKPTPDVFQRGLTSLKNILLIQMSNRSIIHTIVFEKSL